MLHVENMAAAPAWAGRALRWEAAAGVSVGVPGKEAPGGQSPRQSPRPGAELGQGGGESSAWGSPERMSARACPVGPKDAPAAAAPSGCEAKG